MINEEPILTDDSREDTHGCTRAGWEWYGGLKLLIQVVLTCVYIRLVWWLGTLAGRAIT